MSQRGILGRAQWTGGHDVPLASMLRWGALVWGVYAVVQVAVVGSVVDEGTVAAQILTGAVQYPAGHPLAVFVSQAFSLGYWLSAVTWWIVPSPTTVSAVRNVLFMWGSTFVPFAMVVVLTRRPAWGHVAAVLTLSEAACRFFGVYQLHVFPTYYSSGHLGLDALLLTVALLVGQCWVAGGVLLGALPSIHAAMGVLVLPWVAAFLVLGPVTRREARTVVLAAGAVFLITVALALLFRALDASGAGTPPYQWDGGDPAAIMQRFTASTDPHRQPIQIITASHLVSPLACLLLAWLLLRPAGAGRESLDRTAVAWMVALPLLAWAAVYATRLMQAVGDGSMPAPIAQLMPARYANVGVGCLLPLTVVAFTRGRRVAPAPEMALLLACIVLQSVLIATGRRAAYDHMAYVLWGALFAFEWRLAPPALRPGLTGAIVAFGVGLLTVWWVAADATGWSFVAGLALGALLAMSLKTYRRLASAETVQRVLAVTCVAAAGVALMGPYIPAMWDAGGEKTSPYQHELAAWLRERAIPQEPILTPLWPPLMLQAKIAHPILVDPVTLLVPAYMRALAVPVARLIRDVFGIDYADPRALAPLLGPNGKLLGSAWLDAWRARDCAAWIPLRDRYAVRLVLVPNAVPVQLPAVFPGPEWTLREIPRTPADCPPRS